jgi:hypothetical protein
MVIPSQVTSDNSTYYNVTEINSSAFSEKDITSVTFPTTLLKVDDHAFNHCALLSSVFIPSNVTYIGTAAFAFCTAVTTVTINASTSLRIEIAAFSTDLWFDNNGSLNSVFITSETPPTLDNDGTAIFETGLPYFSSSAKIYVPDATDGTATTSTQYIYKQAWSDYASQIFKYYDKKLAGPYSGNYYGTLALPYAVEIPSDYPSFKVYTVSSIKKNEGLTEATMNQISSTDANVKAYIPASTGVVLQNTASYIPRFLETTVSVSAIADNKLKPCLDEGGLTNDYTSYLTLGRDKELLAQGQTVIGFYLYTGETIACNTAYMLYSDAGVKSVTLSFDDAATSINNPAVNNNTQNDEIYDLQGRRVTNPQKGLYIVNGKKVLIRK